MYMSIICKPTDQDLDNYPDVLITSPHEWDLLYWIIVILIHVDTPPQHLILLLGTNMLIEGDINVDVITKNVTSGPLRV